jgi:hypothetical protein
MAENGNYFWGLKGKEKKMLGVLIIILSSLMIMLAFSLVARSMVEK